jgi:hypothetical protein
VFDVQAGHSRDGRASVPAKPDTPPALIPCPHPQEVTKRTLIFIFSAFSSFSHLIADLDSCLAVNFRLKICSRRMEVRRSCSFSRSTSQPAAPANGQAAATRLNSVFPHLFVPSCEGCLVQLLGKQGNHTLIYRHQIHPTSRQAHAVEPPSPGLAVCLLP